MVLIDLFIIEKYEKYVVINLILFFKYININIFKTNFQKLIHCTYQNYF